jgi:hypothetical protein
MASDVSKPDNNCEALPPAVVEAIQLWQGAQILQITASWRGEPAAVAASERLAADPQRFERAVASLLEHPSQLVVGYSLFTLHLMRSSLLASLPDSLLQRRDGLTVQTGSFRERTDLGSYARSQRCLANDRNA